MKGRGVLLLLLFSFVGIALSQEEFFVKKIVIDAGHGGKDPGAVANSVKEKDITLSISLKVGKMIAKELPRVELIYTRTTDNFVELKNRATIANKANADLFVSIHVNSIAKSSIYGAEVYALGLHNTEANRKVAERENSVILYEEDYKTKYENYDPNSDVSQIMFINFQNTQLTQSISLADKILTQIKDGANRKSLGVKQAGFLVLREVSMPSVLVEVGFLTNSTEAKYLTSEKGSQAIAKSIFGGIKSYITQLEETLPSEKYYMIQVLTASKKISKKNMLYKRFSNLISTNHPPFYRYYIDKEFPTEKEAQAYLKKHVNKYVKDAFVREILR